MRGSALLLLLLFVSVVALMILGLHTRTITSIRYLRFLNEREVVFSAAESALTRTRFVLSLYNDWRTNPPSPLFADEPFDGATYTVTLSERKRDTVTADITANKDGTIIRIVARIKRNTDWWNFDWSLRRPVTVSNTTASTLTDHQVRIVVPLYPEMQSDFDDIRFTTDDGTLLNYWIEFYDSSSAIVWVKVPSIPANGSTTIYLYYGNPSATSASSITNTMEPSYIKNSVPYQWTDRVSTTSVVSDDDAGTWVNFAFTFPYWRDYPRVRAYACSNGYLSLHTTNTYGNDWSNSSWELRSRWLVAPFWDDLRTDVVGRRLARNPGLYVDSYPDRIMFDWEATHYWSNRIEIKFQAILYRNGDIRVNIDGARFFNNFTPTLGVSLGDGTNYIDFTGERASNRSWLFTIRKFVSPEPTVTIGEEEHAQKTLLVQWKRY